MASEKVMQAIGRLERAISRVETIARQAAEARAAAIEAQLQQLDGADEESQPAIDIDPFSRDKAIAALKSLDALIGDLQKARSDG